MSERPPRGEKAPRAKKESGPGTPPRTEAIAQSPADVISAEVIREELRKRSARQSALEGSNEEATPSSDDHGHGHSKFEAFMHSKWGLPFGIAGFILSLLGEWFMHAPKALQSGKGGGGGGGHKSSGGHGGGGGGHH